MYDATHGVTVYFEFDVLGNVRRLRGGEAVRSGVATPPADFGGYRYTAFGKQVTDDPETPEPKLADGTAFEQRLRWQGRPAFDTAAGQLYDFRARTWSPALGIFLQADEIQYLTATTTLWSWPGQNPLRWRDPSGRFAFLLALPALGGGAVIAEAAVVVGAAVVTAAAVVGAALGIEAWFARDATKEAEGAMRTDKAFRDWVHREYKPDVVGGTREKKNPDLSPEELLDAWDEWCGR